MLMENIYLPASDRTPEVSLDFKFGRFYFIGESYPKNPRLFLDPIKNQLIELLSQHPNHALDFQFKFDHLDSPSIKLVMDIIEEIEELSHQNKVIKVEWHYPNGNRTLKELGEEIATELSQIQMAIIQKC